MSDQARFVQRVVAFTEHKTFDGRQNFQLTREVEVSIAASAVQLTLGLETWDLSYFNHILVYPADYKSPSTGKIHKGETNMGGFICFSWKAFVEGYANPHDKVNLGLHEFAHALRFNGVKGNHCDHFFENYFARWLASAYSEFKKLQGNPADSIFRKYGGVNINEFFSVAVETFFESPLEFKAALPALYKQTSILLNQTFRDDGSVFVNCRESLLRDPDFQLSKDYAEAMRFNLRYNGLTLVAGLFALVGAVSMSNGGYRYPSPYILFTIALIVWFYFERHYTRILFGKDHFTIQKGFSLTRNISTVTMPYSQLISFKVNYEYAEHEDGSTRKYIGSASVAYYRNGNFYKDELHIDDEQPAFNELCKELKRNRVFVAIKE